METTHRNENKLQTQTPESSKIVFSNTTGYRVMYYKYLSLVFQNVRGTPFLRRRLINDGPKMVEPLEGLLGPPSARANPREGRHKKRFGCAGSRILVYAARIPPLRSGLSGFFWLALCRTYCTSVRAGAGRGRSRWPLVQEGFLKEELGSQTPRRV
jgi:hypothetical protein